MQETWIRFLDREDALEKEMATHSSILAWKIPWTEEPGRLQSMRPQESHTTNYHHLKGTLSAISCLATRGRRGPARPFPKTYLWACPPGSARKKGEGSGVLAPPSAAQGPTGRGPSLSGAWFSGDPIGGGRLLLDPSPTPP